MKQIDADRENSHYAVEKIMRKVREEKKKKVKAIKVLRIIKERSRFELVLLTSLSLALFSCNSLKKQKTETESSLQTKIRLSETDSRQQQTEFSEWQKTSLQGVAWNTAFIRSDSAIQYLPGEGFHISKGTLVVSTANVQNSESEQKQQALQHETHKAAVNNELINDSKERTKETEKERQPPALTRGTVTTLLIVAILFLVLYFLYKRFNKNRRRRNMA